MWKHGHSGYNNHKCRCDICKKAVNEYNRRIQTEYRKRPKVKLYHEAYLAEYRERNREELLAYARDYRRRHKEKLIAQERSAEGRRRRRTRESTRRARKRDQFLEAVDPLVVYEMHGGRCGICGHFVSAREFQVDHLVAIANGGLHGYINCQPAHPRCNLSKGVA
jgi:5-methylcytosine-specific restriction endonuclease McrA